MAEHVHAEVIRAWAGGAQIQYRNKGGEWWDCIEVPSWLDRVEYRVKLAESATGYPQTKMNPGDLGAQLIHAMVGAEHSYEFKVHAIDRLTCFANSILKRAVDDGTVPTKEAYEQAVRDSQAAEQKLLSKRAAFEGMQREFEKCSRDLLEAEKLLESLGYRRTLDGEWEAPMPETQFQRDMKVAEAVRGWYQRQYPDVAMRIVQPDLEHIVRSIK